MPKLVTSNGTVIKFKTVPLFSGSSVINPINAKENLLLFKKIMDRHSLFFALTAGTLLGAIREHDFIKHDEDIDLALFAKDKQQVIDIIPEFYEVGFKVVRYDRRNVISIMRKGDYIDLCFFEPYEDGIYDCDGTLILAQFMENIGQVKFLGEVFNMPMDAEEYLLCEYGQDWRTPRHFFNFNQPKHKILLYKLKEYIKDYLPDFLYNKFAVKAAANHRLEFYGRFDRYRKDKQG